MADALADRARRDLRLPRWLCPARAQCRKGRQRAGAGVVGVLPDGHKQLLALELCGRESLIAWKGCLEDLVERGLRAPVLAIIDGNPGLRRAVGEATNGRATLLCAQAARPRAESPEARPLGDPGRLPSHRLRGQR